MTETPRTDAVALRLVGVEGLFCDDKSMSQYNDLVDVSRTLEADLIATQKERDAWKARAIGIDITLEGSNERLRKAEQALALRGEPVAWIDIDAKLPDAGVQVLCTGFCCDVDELENAIPNEKRWYAVAHRTEFNQWKPEMHGATDGIDDLYKPTHWTPLPSLYAAPISGEPVAWAPRLTTDDKSPYQVVLASLRRYAKTWPPQTDLFRKIRAMDVVRAINEVEALYAAPISGEREAAFFRDAPSPPDAPPRAVSGERVREALEPDDIALITKHRLFVEQERDFWWVYQDAESSEWYAGKSIKHAVAAFVAALPLAAQPELHDPRDWPEDFRLENGNYSCRCSGCGKLFNGHKRRVVCKLCAAQPEGE